MHAQGLVSAKGASAFWDTRRLNKNLHAWTQSRKWLHLKSGKALVIVDILDVRGMHPKVLADAAVVVVGRLTDKRTSVGEGNARMSADVGAWWPSLLADEASRRTCIQAKPGMALLSWSTSWMCEACIQMFWLSRSL